MNRINSYVLQQLGITAAISGFVLVFAIWLTQSLKLIELVVEGGAPSTLFLRLVVLAMPEMVIMVLPVAVAAGIIFVYNRLTVDREVTVMRAAGLGPLRMAMPALILGLTVMALSYTLSLVVWPLADREFREMRFLVQTEYANAALREGEFTELGDNTTLYFRERSSSGRIHQIIVYDGSNANEPVTLVASSGLFVRTDTGPRVLMWDGNRQVRLASGQVDFLHFDEYVIDLQLVSQDNRSDWTPPRSRFVNQLLNPDPANERDQQFASVLIAEGHNRLAVPLWVMAVASVATCGMLMGEFGRQGQRLRMTVTIATVALMIGTAQAVSTFPRDNPSAIPLLYALPLTCMALAFAGLFVRPATLNKASRRLSSVLRTGKA